MADGSHHDSSRDASIDVCHKQLRGRRSVIDRVVASGVWRWRFARSARAAPRNCRQCIRRLALLSQPTQKASMPRPHGGRDISVAIVGAGLSGLCLAQALHSAGLDVSLYERDSSPHARRQGYRITLDERGGSALQKCLPEHKFEAVLATASSVERVGYFRFTNQQLGEIFKLTFKHNGRDSRQVIGQADRATLRSILLAGLEDRTHFGKVAARVVQAPDGATNHFTDGTSTRASIVIGADGIHS